MEVDEIFNCAACGTPAYEHVDTITGRIVPKPDVTDSYVSETQDELGITYEPGVASEVGTPTSTIIMRRVKSPTDPSLPLCWISPTLCYCCPESIDKTYKFERQAGGRLEAFKDDEEFPALIQWLVQNEPDEFLKRKHQYCMAVCSCNKLGPST